MGKLKYLLVCEGPADVALIKGLATSMAEEAGTSVDILPVSPRRDATTGKWPAHGWGEVRHWCKKFRYKTDEELANTPESIRARVKRNYWLALVKSSNADGLIIQLDTDIAEEITDLPTPFNPTSDNRRNHCQQAVLHWLALTGNETEQPFLLLPSYAMEAWMLALHEPDVDAFSDLAAGFDYEAIPDTETRLIALGYPYKRKNKRKRLEKREQDYLQHADKIYQSYDKVAGRCKEAEHFRRFLKKALVTQMLRS